MKGVLFDLCAWACVTMGRRKGGETVHPGRECESCAYCGAIAESYRHPENWKEQLKQWLVSSLN